MYFNGMRVIPNPMLTKSGEPKKIKRSWKERLFSIPWMPLVEFRYEPTQIPSREVIVDKINNCMYAHPVVVNEIKNILERQNDTIRSNTELRG